MSTEPSALEGLLFYLNGQRTYIANPRADMSLATYIRQVAHLTGLKVACAEGGCGACTAVLSYHDPNNYGKFIHKAVATCLVPLCGIDGMAVTTTEGLGNSRDGLHAIQEAMVRNHATQCGMCTPGMVMELYAACLNNQYGPCMKALSEIEECFDGNLCRCTGYRAIRDAGSVLSFLSLSLHLSLLYPRLREYSNSNHRIA